MTILTEENEMTNKQSGYDPETGRPFDKSYLECGLPEFLQTSIENMKKSWEIEDR